MERDYEWYRDALISMTERQPTDEEIKEFAEQFEELQKT